MPSQVKKRFSVVSYPGKKPDYTGQRIIDMGWHQCLSCEDCDTNCTASYWKKTWENGCV